MERLQTVPEGYTKKNISYNQASKLLGDGWTVDIIAEFFRPLGKPFTMPQKVNFLL